MSQPETIAVVAVPGRTLPYMDGDGRTRHAGRVVGYDWHTYEPRVDHVPAEMPYYRRALSRGDIALAPTNALPAEAGTEAASNVRPIRRAAGGKE